MYRNEQPVSASKVIAMILVLGSAIAMEQGLVNNPRWYFVLWITLPLLVIYACIDRK